MHSIGCSRMWSLVGSFILVIGLRIGLVSCDPAKASFINFSEEELEVHWINEKDQSLHPIGKIAPYEGDVIDTHLSHTFQFGEAVATVDRKHSVFMSHAPEQIRVKCTTTSGPLHIMVIPRWSPHGAARFIGLVVSGHFTGCALNRVVKGFLTQFGISADYEKRTSMRTRTIPDDDPLDGMTFRPGFLSYAGSGPDSRTTEMFIVMPDAPGRQLEHFGTNSWETPFGFVERDDLEVVARWHAYGDMPPWGEGPDPQKIYEKDGYKYLTTEYPEMSYILKCEVIPMTTFDEL